jgi:hypothetical protein
MLWIQCNDEMFDHPKVMKLTEQLGISRNDVIAGLLHFWCWCLKYAPDGDLRKFTPSAIAAAFWYPISEGDQLVNAMIECHWLEVTPYFRVHDWWQYQGLYLQGRYKRRPGAWKRIRELYEGGAAEVDEPEIVAEMVEVRRPGATTEQFPDSSGAAPTYNTVHTVQNMTVHQQPPQLAREGAADDAAEDLTGLLFQSTGRSKYALMELAQIRRLKRTHGVRFEAACAKLHGGVDNPAAYLAAVLEPREASAVLAEKARELMERRRG